MFDLIDGKIEFGLISIDLKSCQERDPSGSKAKVKAQPCDKDATGQMKAAATTTGPFQCTNLPKLPSECDQC